MVAESGVESRAQGAAAELAGADAILVGSALMRAPDPAAKLAELLSRPLVKVCGLTRQEDVDAAVDAGADLTGFILAAETPRARRGVLDVPETVLSVAVYVGEPGEDGADLVQLYARENGHRSREAALLRDGDEVAPRSLDLPWDGDGSGAPRAARRPPRAAIVLAGEARPGERARGDRGGPPLGRRRLVAARDGARRQGPRARARVRRRPRGATEPYGDYGGRYVPETLIPALDELEAGWRDARRPIPRSPRSSTGC